MSKRRSSAAIATLLDDIQAAGLQPVTASDVAVEEPIEGNNRQTSKQQQTATINPFPGYPVSTKSFATEPNIGFEIKKVGTSLCRPWKLANRINDFISIASCEDLIESIKHVGQQIPAIVRKSSTGQGYDLICGARRLFACKHLNVDILVAVVDLTDQEALLAMDAENRPRQDISPYERALDYKRWVETGIYKNYNEIGNAIGVKKSLFSKLMTLAELDESIIYAFKHPANLKAAWGYALYNLLRDSSSARQIISTAKELAKQNLAPEEVFSRLKNCMSLKKDKSSSETEWIFDAKSKKKLWGIKHEPSGNVQFIFTSAVPKEALSDLKKQVKTLMNSLNQTK